MVVLLVVQMEYLILQMAYLLNLALQKPAIMIVDFIHMDLGEVQLMVMNLLIYLYGLALGFNTAIGPITLAIISGNLCSVAVAVVEGWLQAIWVQIHCHTLCQVAKVPGRSGLV